MKTNVNITLLFLMSVFIALTVRAQTTPTVFISPMTDGFDNYITAAMMKKKVPLTPVLNDTDAQYIIVGAAEKSTGGKWYDTVFGSEKARNQGSIKLICVSTKQIVWAGNAGDKSRWFAAWKKHGKTKVANRLAKKLKKYFDSERKKPTTPCP